MIFTTPAFVLFFLFFFLMWHTVAPRWKKPLLLISSYVFYGSWHPVFLILIWLSTLVDFWIGGALHRATGDRRRRRLVAISVMTNLGILSAFKYFNFFVDSAVAILGMLGLHASAPLLEIILPVGISFYTFQTMSYSIDVYRRRITPVSSVMDFAIFVAFFPQLVAGPIERAQRLLPQIARLASARTDHSGWGLIALGCFKKVVIADNLAELVNLVYAQPEEASAPALLLATYAFAVQIYCDFSGYSDIAVGLARLLGIELVQNFKAPYAAIGPSDFWRRWHISLSTWLRDYLYISLGGNRRGPLSTYRNLLLTMLLGGLWHGAAWHFVAWGAFHGLLLCCCRPSAFQSAHHALAAHRFGGPIRVVQRFVFFHLVCVGWIFFRAENLTAAVSVLTGLGGLLQTDWATWIAQVRLSSQGGWLIICTGMIVSVVLMQILRPTDSKALVARLWKAPEPVRFAVLVIVFYGCAVAAPESAPPFIYFQF
ncbi:MAG: MBOAT family O-acyltransferase [Myxococcota bacterium]|nr:MBOAT family O-acyltransferase [Myxococcota bacterium]